MKFLLRCLLVLAVAVVCGVGLYYAVQALPNGSPTVVLTRRRPETQKENSVPVNPRPRSNGSESNLFGGFRPRAVVGSAGKAVLFSVIVFIAVIAKNLIFERKPPPKK